MINNLLAAVESEATQRNHEVIARVLVAVREDAKEAVARCNPGVDQIIIDKWVDEGGTDRLDFLIYGADS